MNKYNHNNITQNNVDNFNEKYGKSFCIKPWTEIATSSSGHMKLCCFSHSIGDEDMAYYKGKFKTVFNNKDLIINIRKKMLKGEPIKACTNCYEQEKMIKNPILSMRLEDSIDLLKDKPKIFNDIFYNNKTHIRSIDLKFGNKCNYACIMCSSDSSSLHSKEIEKTPYPDDVQKFFNGGIKPHYFDFPDNKWDELLDISANLVQIKSTGGEPLLLEGFKKYIKKLVEKGYSKNIVFTTVTNGTVDCTDLLPYMNEFKEFRLRWSVDGTDSTYDYIRFPGNFNRMKRTHERIANSYIRNNYKNIRIHIDPTIQLFNVHNIIELLKYAESLRMVNRVEMGYIYDEPEYLNAGLMPDNMLKEIFKKADDQMSSIKINNNYKNIKEIILSKQKSYNLKRKQELFKLTQSMVDYWKRVRKIDVRNHIATYDEIVNWYANK